VTTTRRAIRNLISTFLPLNALRFPTNHPRARVHALSGPYCACPSGARRARAEGKKLKGPRLVNLFFFGGEGERSTMYPLVSSGSPALPRAESHSTAKELVERHKGRQNTSAAAREKVRRREEERRERRIALPPRVACCRVAHAAPVSHPSPPLLRPFAPHRSAAPRLRGRLTFRPS
jgi:hypothetical protein